MESTEMLVHPEWNPRWRLEIGAANFKKLPPDRVDRVAGLYPRPQSTISITIGLPRKESRLTYEHAAVFIDLPRM
jgi:hypothetical protein